MIVGIDIGGTKISVGGFEHSGGRGGLQPVTAIETLPTPAQDGGDAIVSTLVDLVVRMRTGHEVTGVGVGSAGVIGADGTITSATDAIADWAGYPLRAELQRRLGCVVTVVNDVHAAAVAESALGAGVLAGSMLMVTVGTGIGGAVVLSDGLRTGATGTGGSLGHTEIALPRELADRVCSCGVTGHVEAVASGPGLERTYRDLTGDDIGLREIAAMADRGDAVTVRLLADGARFLGQALASANALLDVEMIVIGGGVSQIGGRYLSDIEAAYRTRAMPGPATARIAPAALGVNASLTGAALSAVNGWRSKA